MKSEEILSTLGKSFLENCKNNKERKMDAEKIKEIITPRVCYMGNVKTFDTFEGLLAAEKYIKKHNLNISTSFGNVYKNPPQGEILDCGYTNPITDEDVIATQGAIKMINNQENIYSFVDNPCKTKDLYFYVGARILFKIASGMKLNKQDENFIFEKYDLMNYGICKHGGWVFDFRPYFKEYWIRDKDGNIFSKKAPSEKILKRYLKETGYRIDKIVEV
jgi:hypothetical protein